MKIDLNSDLGESFGAWNMGDDGKMLDIVSSANVACGFHAGDPAGILKTLQTAKAKNVAVGAHVSYPDLVGFGRRNMDVGSADLKADVIYQIGALKGLAAAVGAKVAFVKPHGALYNAIAHDKRQAMAVIEGMLAVDAKLILVALSGTPLIEWAETAGLRTVSEVFADRAYLSDGQLVPRSREGSVLHDPQAVAARMLHLVKEGTVQAIDGTTVRLKADSICVHGDSPGAVAMAAELRKLLEKSGVAIHPFSDR